MTNRPPQRALFFGMVAAIVLASGGYVWHRSQQSFLPTGFVEGDGRIEAAVFAVVTHVPGRLVEVLVKEGDSVQAGQIVAHMDALPPIAGVADTALKVTRGGRVNARWAAPGDLLPTGGTVLTLTDPNDLFVSLTLPERSAGKVAIGADVRMVLYPTLQYVVPAKVSSFDNAAPAAERNDGAGSAQQERTLRGTAHIYRELLGKYRAQLTPGLPGRVYVRLNPAAEWPPHLKIRLPH